MHAIEAFENDLQSFVAQVDTLKPAHKETHALAWQLHQRDVELRNAQRGLVDLQTSLLDERKQMLRVLADNDELRVQELKDRRKIRWLLALTADTNHVQGMEKSAIDNGEITYFRNYLHNRFVHPPPSQSPTSDRLSAEHELPLEEEVVALRLHLQTLRTQLREQRKLHDDCMATLASDREHQARRFEYQQAQDALRISELVKRTGILQELLRLRRSGMVTERLYKEERATMLQQNSELDAQLSQLRSHSETVEQVVESRVVKKNESVLHDLRTQLARREEEIRISRLAKEDTDVTHNKKVAVMQSKIERMGRDYKTLKRRRDYEIEGFTADILALRKQIQALEKMIIRFGQVDECELVLLDSAKNTSKKASHIQDQVTVLKRKMYQAEKELQAMAV